MQSTIANGIIHFSMQFHSTYDLIKLGCGIVMRIMESEFDRIC